MKHLKLYVAIAQAKGFGKQKHLSTTLVCVDNCPIVKAQLPEERDLVEHLLLQRMRIQRQEPFVSIKIALTKERYKEVCQEISHKIGQVFQLSVVDLVFESGQKPIIQIVPEEKKEEPKILSRFKRTR